MDFDFPPDIIMLRDMLRRFVQKEARPLEMKYFTSGTLEPEERLRLRQAIEQMGLWGLTVPEEFGGGGLDTTSACLIEEELGKTFIPLDTGEVPLPLYACSEEQIGQFLEPVLAGERRAIIAAREPGPTGAQPDCWMTSAGIENGGYRINGRKSLSTSPEADDFLILYARLPQGLSAFLVEADLPGLKISQDGDTLAVLEDCCLPAGALLGEAGGALQLGAPTAPHLWIRTGARYVGIVERLLEMASEHAQDWISHGAALAVRPAIQEMLAEMRTDVESARWLVYHAAWLADTGSPEALRSTAAQVRLATGGMLQRAVDRTTMIFCGPGTSAQIEPQRMVRSVVPYDALQLALQQARAIIAATELNREEG
jgi:acyl-CoA dehydrogenase